MAKVKKLALEKRKAEAAKKSHLAQILPNKTTGAQSSVREAWTDVSNPIIKEEPGMDADGEESYYDEEEESEYYDTEIETNIEKAAKVVPSDKRTDHAGPSDK